MTTSQNLKHQENNLFDFLTTADTVDFVLHTETSNEGSQETSNEPTAEEEKNISNYNELSTTNMIVSHGNYKIKM